MKTALLTLGMTAVFLGAGLGALKMMAPPAEPEPGDVTADTAASGPACSPDSAAADLAATLEAMQSRLAAAEGRADSLRSVMNAHQSDAALAQTDVAELAATLTRMEDDALRNIVQRLDGRSFVKLYAAATTRNQGRLLGALTPAQAASFVRSRLPGGSGTPTRTASAQSGRGPARDSTATSS